MGTSASNKGSNGGSPLVPPWADTDGAGAGPAPNAARFRGFRTQLGKFVASGERGHLERALGRYARDSLGGRSTGVRRFNQMISAGGKLAGLLSELAAGGDGTGTTGVDLRRLAGLPIETAIQALVEAVAPEEGDRELIRAAMQEALLDCLENQDIFDPSAIGDGLLADMIAEYLAQCVFTHIVNESGQAFEKTSSIVDAAHRENELMELIRTVVDDQASRVLVGQPSLSSAQVDSLQRSILAGVLDVWEAYE